MKQLTLTFEALANARRTGPTAAGEVGIASSAAHAEDDAPGWLERAVDALRRFAWTVPDFTIEEARAAMHVDPPAELRAWGAVTQTAVRRGIIERTGGFRSAESSNGSPKPVYRAVGATL